MRDISKAQFVASLERNGIGYSNEFGFQRFEYPCGVASLVPASLSSFNLRSLLREILAKAEGHTVKPCRKCYEAIAWHRIATNKERAAIGKELLPELGPFEGEKA